MFDLFHLGHLNLLERCKEQCDYLIIAICGDDYVTQVKKKAPVFTEEERIRIIGALKCVDDVSTITLEEMDDKMKAWERFHFDALFSGDDWKGSERYNRTEEQFSKVGVAIEYLPYTKRISTTKIKEKMNGKSNKLKSKFRLFHNI